MIPVQRTAPHRLAPRILVAAVAFCGVVVGLAGCPMIRSTPPAPGPAPQPPEDVGLDEPTIQRLEDAVVFIDVTLDTPQGEATATGSGFLISEEGHIITNAHVVSPQIQTTEGATLAAESRSISVSFHAGTEEEQSHPATIVRENPDIDLALLQVDLEEPVYLELGDSEAATLTSRVFACGHPLGLREISIRSGSVTAHRTWDGRRFIEHDALTEGGNSGGPVVNSEARVIGVHTLCLVTDSMQTKFAIPSNIVSQWLKTNPSEDPGPTEPGASLRALLTAARLTFDEADPGVFSLPYEGDVTLFCHQFNEFLRFFASLGELPGDSGEVQGEYALEALRFNYLDPVGRLSVLDTEDTYALYWESQIPKAVATSEYVAKLADVGANQVERWRQVLAGEEIGEPEHLYPGGDEESLRDKLKQTIEQAELTYEEDDKGFLNLEFDNGVTVRATIYRGLVYTFCYCGGMPGTDEAEQGAIAIELLKRNWDDAFGRLSLDDDNDVVWESQVPADFLTSDYFTLLARNCANQVAGYLETFGEIPLNGG